MITLFSINKTTANYFFASTSKKQKHKGPGGNNLIVKYKGPKHFLQEDKDYYLQEKITQKDK
ncbi:hypothetical protein M33023_02780 [Candidatus Phytoplasma asteris]|uniref:Uncharacterized protein n=1 Tax=Candidatus Phytoplasma asteris TaxID=85620 RepID=A0ABZ2YEW1_9MOLU